VLSLACAIIAKWAQPAHGVPGIELWKRPFLAGNALAYYLYKLIFPLRLGLDYGWRPPAIAQQWWFWVPWIMPAALLVILLLGRKRVPELWAAALVFVIGVAPVLGFSRFLFQFFSTVADHYLYLAMLGPALAAAWVVARSFNRIVLAACAIVLIAIGARTFLQARHWQNDLTLFQHAIDVNPDSFLFTRNLGYVYKMRGQYDLAEPLLRRAIQIKPDHWEAHLDLAEILFVRGEIDEAIGHVETAIQIKRALPEGLGVDYVQNQVTLADTLVGLGRFERAVKYYRQAIEARPLDVELRQKLDEAIRLARETATRPATSPAATTVPR
jgi:tetratricopeptide (TPR) repeat protein